MIKQPRGLILIMRSPKNAEPTFSFPIGNMTLPWPYHFSSLGTNVNGLLYSLEKNLLRSSYSPGKKRKQTRKKTNQKPRVRRIQASAFSEYDPSTNIKAAAANNRMDGNLCH